MRNAILGRDVTDIDIAVAGDARRARPAHRRGSGRSPLRALRRLRHLAGPGSRRLVGARRRRAARRPRSRTTCGSATSPSTRSPCRSRAGRRSTRPAASPTSRPGSCARRRRAPSPTIRSASSAPPGSPPSSGSRSSRTPSCWRARRPGGRRSRPVSASSPSSPGWSPVPIRSPGSRPWIASGRRRRSCPSSRPCAASARAPTTTSTCTATRSRCCAAPSSSSGSWTGTRASPPRRSGGSSRCPLADGLTRRDGLRFAAHPARHRQAGDAAGAGRLGQLHRPRRRRRRDGPRPLPPPADLAPPRRARRRDHPRPPRARLHGPGSAAAAAAGLGVPAADRPAGDRHDPADRRRPALRAGRRGPRTRRSRGTWSSPARCWRPRSPWELDGPAEPLLRGDEIAAEAGIEPGPRARRGGRASSRRPSTRARWATAPRRRPTCARGTHPASLRRHARARPGLHLLRDRRPATRRRRSSTPTITRSRCWTSTRRRRATPS